MRIFTAIEDLIRSKEGQYGRQDDFPTHRILARLDPHFRAVSACKHLFAYVRTRALKELVKAAAYIALEYEERMTEDTPKGGDRIEAKGYNPPPTNRKRPEKPTPAPPPKKYW